MLGVLGDLNDHELLADIGGVRYDLTGRPLAAYRKRRKKKQQ